MNSIEFVKQSLNEVNSVTSHSIKYSGLVVWVSPFGTLEKRYAWFGEYGEYEKWAIQIVQSYKEYPYVLYINDSLDYVNKREEFWEFGDNK